MSHPGPLFADYVDGTLDPSTRAEVDAHLRTCATCRAELALSTAGAASAGRLTAPASPAGMGKAAVAEAQRLAAERNPEVTPIAGRARRRPTTSRVLAVAGAAAVIIFLALIAPKLGQGSSQRSEQAAAAGAARPSAYPVATGVEIQHADYTFAALVQSATELRTALTASEGYAGPSPGEQVALPSASVPALDAQDVSTDATLLPKATACLNKAFDSPPGTLSRVIRATYGGQPAYLGVYLIGPGADLPPTLLQLSAASVHGCQRLGQATARL